MQLTGAQSIAAPRQRIWDALNDPEVLRACIPGCQALEKESADRYAATIEVKIGPIGARFKGAVGLSDLNPPNGYTISGEGNAGIAGTAKGGAKVRLSDAPGGTLISYTVDAQVGGRLAQLGGPIIDATAKQLAAKFFGNFARVIGGEAAAAGAPPKAGAASASAREAVIQTPAPSATPAPRSFPFWTIFALGIAVVLGFLLGSSDMQGQNWAGLSIGLLVIVVAAAAFEYGRRSAAPVVMLDMALLRRLIDGAKQ